MRFKRQDRSGQNRQADFLRTNRAGTGVVVTACLLLLLLLPACRPDPTDPTFTLSPTVISPSPVPKPTTDQTTTQPAAPVAHELVPLESYGSLSSGHTLLLPAGIWLDTAAVDTIGQVAQLVVTTAGQGRPTLSRQDESKPLLTIIESESVTFRQIRFGYDRPDWPNQVQAGAVALIELIDSQNIRFEDCEFFGGPGAAVLLNGSANIVFQNCTFYNQAGSPLETGNTELPSQIRATDCLFETIDSGFLPLNVRDSSFDRCEWVGRQGYRVPIAAFDRQEAATLMQLRYKNLPQQLTGILAGRVDFFSDDAAALTFRDNVFASDEVFALFDRMEQTLPDLLPAHVMSWSLSGQKAEEVDPDNKLDPTLGLQLALRVQTQSEPDPAGESSPASDRLYDINRLIEDLQALKPLENQLDPLISGRVAVVLHNQRQQKVLSASLPLNSLGNWLDPARSDRLLTEGQIVLYHPDLIPADFCLREQAGAFAAAHVMPLLLTALDISPEPLIVYPQEEACYIEGKLDYLGTSITAAAAEHLFANRVEWTTTQNASDKTRRWADPVFYFTVQADTGQKALLAPDDTQIGFRLADIEETELIRRVLQNEPIPSEQADGRPLMLQTLSAWTETTQDCLPLYLLQVDEQQIDLLTVLYDEQSRPVAVSLILIQEEGDFRIRSSRVYPD